MDFEKGSRVRMSRDWCDLIGVPCLGSDTRDWRGTVVELNTHKRAVVDWDHGERRHPAIRYLEPE